MKIYFLFKMGIFHCYVSLPEGNTQNNHVTCLVKNVAKPTKLKDDSVLLKQQLLIDDIWVKHLGIFLVKQLPSGK